MARYRTSAARPLASTRALCAAVAAVLPALLTMPAQAADADVRVSPVGYAPKLAKLVSVTGNGSTFVVKAEGTGKVVLEGKLGAMKLDDDTRVPVRKADISSLQTPGLYRVEVPGVGKSAPFPIAADVYDEPLRTAMLGFYGLRASVPVDLTHGGQRFQHAAGHTADGLLDYLGKPGETKDGAGGWYDAGDYGRYTINGAYSLGILLRAWEDHSGTLTKQVLQIPEKTATPDFLDELRVQVQWLLKMQFADGSATHKFTTLDFSGFVMPAADTDPVYYAPIGSAATADLAAVLAQASRVFATHDPALATQCKDAALLAWAWLQAHPEPVSPDLSAFTTGGYGTGDVDDRQWAAAEVWETTGDAAALTALESALYAQSQAVSLDSDWGNVKNLPALTYLASKREGRDPALVERVAASLMSAADEVVTNTEAHGFGRGFARYQWGSNGVVARLCMITSAAAARSKDAKYTSACAEQLAYLYGRNHFGRSQVTGDGLYPPCFPHDRRSGADSVVRPYPGLLVGGSSKATNWQDVESSYETNEVAINWQAALVYALASLSTGAAKSSVSFKPPVYDCQSPAPPPAQPDQTPVSGPPVLIDDFTDGDQRILERDGRSGAWFAFDDGTGTSNGVEIFPEGRDGKGFSLLISAESHTRWGGGVGALLKEGATGAGETYDASGFTGISFWASADRTQDVSVMIPDFYTDSRGRCTKCSDHFYVSFVATTEWKQYRFAWDSFKQQGFGDARPKLDTRRIYAIQFQYGRGGPYGVLIDDLAFATPGKPDDGSGGQAGAAGAAGAGGAAGAAGSAGSGGAAGSAGAPTVGASDNGVSLDGGGCGCGVDPASGGSAWLALPLLLALRRRRPAR